MATVSRSIHRLLHGGGGEGMTGGHGGHDGAYDDVAADLMEQGSVRLRPHHQLALVMGERPVEEERQRPAAKKRSPPTGHSRRPTTMKFGKVTNQTTTNKRFSLDGTFSLLKRISRSIEASSSLTTISFSKVNLKFFKRES
jgi:hypothetical protein